MSKLKQYNQDLNVLEAARQRMVETFDSFEKIYLSFSGGKDSTVMFHLAMEEAQKRNRKIGILVVDLEAQYAKTIEHITEMLDKYDEFIDPYWVCLPIKLRNAVSNFEPTWTCWDKKSEALWVRELPKHKSVVTENTHNFPFFINEMEFEEFVPLFGEWYSENGKYTTACLVGIRADESLSRFRTIASKTKEKYANRNYTTKILDGLYNVYPIYDWKTQDIWKYTGKYNLCFNQIYDYMYRANMSIHEMRLCQPYGDDQKQGLWLYHILEAATWYKVVNRVNGVNSGALYVREKGRINGRNKVIKPDNHTWESFSKLLMATLPSKMRMHYEDRFTTFLKGWKGRGYTYGIPDEAPEVLEKKMWAPSWRRIARVLLRNDYWCKGLGLTQPKSPAYGKYLEIKKKRQANGK